MTLSTAAHELELYATNVECWINPVAKTLGKKHKKGIFNYDKAIYCVERYCLIPAAQQYNLENGSMSTPWHSIFPKVVRLEAAESIVKELIEEFRLGNY